MANRHDYNFWDDARFALTGHQLKNHGVHFAIGLGISLAVLGLADWPWWGPLTACFTGALKELLEAWKRAVQNQPLHVVDSILDFSGWVLAGFLPLFFIH